MQRLRSEATHGIADGDGGRLACCRHVLTQRGEPERPQLLYHAANRIGVRPCKLATGLGRRFPHLHMAMQMLCSKLQVMSVPH